DGDDLFFVESTLAHDSSSLAQSGPSYMEKSHFRWTNFRGAGHDLLTNCIEIGLEKGIEAFDKYTLWALNYAAVANIAQFGGRFREEPIYVSDHVPPSLRRSATSDGFVLFFHPRELDS
ncbi:MAG: hypothetical protein WCA13_21000, partial [Terriglobales bacterium]